jgi:hypothetical protein
MKKILLVLLVFFSSCHKIDKENYYINEKFILVGTNEVDGFSNDKFHKPLVTKIWLIERVSNPTEHAELTSEDEYNGRFKITKDLWYNRKIGDTLYFEFINKDRFFKIKKHE